MALGVCYMAPPADAGTQIRVLSGWGLGPDLVSLDPCLCDALGMVGVIVIWKIREILTGIDHQQRQVNVFGTTSAVAGITGPRR